MLPTAQAVLSDPPDGKADYICALTYEERFLRRRKLTTDCGTSFVVDLPKTTDLKQGDHLVLSNGKTGDHVIEHMIKLLGGQISHVNEPFNPEGGAYGIGRTHSHNHGNSHHGPSGDTYDHAHEH